jgi:hypothetical protein
MRQLGLGGSTIKRSNTGTGHPSRRRTTSGLTGMICNPNTLRKNPKIRTFPKDSCSRNAIAEMG